MTQASQTQEFIYEGFWMQGEFVCFMTLDESNKVFIELFGFDTEDIYSLCDKVEVGDLSHFEIIKTVVSENREFIVVLFYSNVSLLWLSLLFIRSNQRTSLISKDRSLTSGSSLSARLPRTLSSGKSA